MKILDIPDAFETLPNKVQTAGIEVVLFDQDFPFDRSPLKLRQHVLMINLDGEIAITCNSIPEKLKKGEAIMIKKNALVRFAIEKSTGTTFRSLLIFFDEPSLRYALMPFEIIENSTELDYFTIPLNDKLIVFTDSILLYYSQTKEASEWAMLLQNKLRELLWIFFHTEMREQAKLFFKADVAG
jgi:hypothetical protein